MKDPREMTTEELKKQIAEDQEEERKEREVHSLLVFGTVCGCTEAQLYTDGYRWSVDACIHPEVGGDDYLITLYYEKKPTNKAIEANLKKQGSCLIEGQYCEPKEIKDPNKKENGEMTTKEKLARLNELRVANNMKPLKTWKQSVAKLDAALEKLNDKTIPAEITVEAEEEENRTDVKDLPKASFVQDEEADRVSGYVDLDERFGTIRAAAEFMLLEKDENDEGLPYKFILRCVHANFPKAKTSIACLRWYANKMNQRGEIMPPRKSGNRKK